MAARCHADVRGARGVAHAPSPDVLGGSGLPMPSRRTLATVILTFALSEVSALSPGTDLPQADWSGFACHLRRLEGMGNPSLDTADTKVVRVRSL